MILYIDETASKEYFIVAGLLVNSALDVAMAYKRFKKHAKRYKISKEQKANLFIEFKSTKMDKHFQKLKLQMLTELNNFEYCAIYSCYIKRDSVFSQRTMERSYLNLISKIVSTIDKDVEVIFDRFNKKDFEEAIVKKLQSFSHVTSAKPEDSQNEAGIQYADNLCSVIRLYKTNADPCGFYQVVEPFIKEFIKEV